MSAKNKTKFKNNNEFPTVSKKKKSIAGSRSESGLSGHCLGNVSVSTSSFETKRDSNTPSTKNSDSDSDMELDFFFQFLDSDIDLNS